MPHFEQSQATGYRNLLERIRDFASGDHVDTVAVAAGGTGYTLGDVLTMAGGTVLTVAATVEVTGVSAGVITAVEIRQSGSYSVNPSTPNSPTGGTGAGASITLTFSGVLWTVNRDETGNHQTGETELQLEGVGSGSDEIFIGIRTYTEGGGATNWELAGFTGFTSGNTWELQPGKSPGRFDSALGSAVVPLANAAMNYWFNLDGRRIIVVARAGGGYASCYLGFMNQYATDTEYPYPLLILGSSSRVEQVQSDTEITYSGISDPIREEDDDDDVGPGFFRFTDGQWYSVFNSEIVGAARIPATNVIVFPSGNPVNPEDDIDRWYPIGTTDSMADFIPSSGTPGSPSKTWRPTNDAGGDIYPTWPCTVMMTTPSRQIIGEIDDVRWFPAVIGPVFAEDTLISDKFTAFQCGNRSEPWALFLMRTRPA